MLKDEKLVCYTLREMKTLISLFLVESEKPDQKFVKQWFSNRKYKNFGIYVSDKHNGIVLIPHIDDIDDIS